MRIKNKKVRNILNLLGVLTFVAFLTWFVVHGRGVQKDLKENGCYTIGVTDGFRYKHKRGMGAYFIYTYKGKEYRNWELSMDGTKYNGGKYLVKLSSKNPENAEMDVTIRIEGDTIPIEYRPLCSEIEKLE